MSVETGAESGAQTEFGRLITLFSDSDEATENERIRLKIWERFGTMGTTFISDMANFSSTSRTRGICQFLKMIHRAREAIRPIIADNQGLLLKCDADNCYAYFEHADHAVQASFDINAELFRLNGQRDLSERIFLSVGIDYGRLLLVGDEDFYGDPVNTASKLGEDLAGKSETLITERALAQSSFSLNEQAERMTARISDIEISYVKLAMTEIADR